MRISFNLASWSAWGITPDWKTLIADIVAETDFYVINPSTMVTADMVEYLNGNGRTNTLVPVMHTHSPEEMIRLCSLAPAPFSPMINTLDLLATVWPPATNLPPMHPLFRFTFDGADTFENTGDADEIGFSSAVNVTRIMDASGAINSAIFTQGTPPTSLALSNESLSRLNTEAAREFSLTISARATRFNTPQVIALGMQNDNPRYVAGFYLLDGNAYFIFTHTNNVQTWVLAGDMTDRKWHQFVATCTSGQITTYQDGAVVSAMRPAVPLIRPPFSAFVVARDSLLPERTFTGALDEFAYYPYALSQDEVWTMNRKGNGTPPPPPSAHWLIDEPTAPSRLLPDSSRQGSLALTAHPNSTWEENRAGVPRSSLGTSPGQESGAFLESPAIGRLNSVLGSGWSISGWIKLQQTAGTQYLLGGQNRFRANRYHLGFAAYDGAALFFVRRASGEQIVATAGSIAAGSWQHVAATCNGFTLTTYLNGSRLTSVPLGPSLLTLDQFTDFSIGFDPADATRTANGSFDDIRIHPFALTPDEVGAAATSIPAGL